MSRKESSLSRDQKAFSIRDSSGNFGGIVISKTPEDAKALVARSNGYLDEWAKILKQGKKIGTVVTNPSTATPAEAIRKTS